MKAIINCKKDISSKEKQDIVKLSDGKTILKIVKKLIRVQRTIKIENIGRTEKKLL